MDKCGTPEDDDDDEEDDSGDKSFGVTAEAAAAGSTGRKLGAGAGWVEGVTRRDELGRGSDCDWEPVDCRAVRRGRLRGTTENDGKSSMRW